MGDGWGASVKLAVGRGLSRSICCLQCALVLVAVSIACLAPCTEVPTSGKRSAAEPFVVFRPGPGGSLLVWVHPKSSCDWANQPQRIVVPASSRPNHDAVVTVGRRNLRRHGGGAVVEFPSSAPLRPSSSRPRFKKRSAAAMAAMAAMVARVGRRSGSWTTGPTIRTPRALGVENSAAPPIPAGEAPQPLRRQEELRGSCLWLELGRAMVLPGLWLATAVGVGVVVASRATWMVVVVGGVTAASGGVRLWPRWGWRLWRSPRCS